MYLRSQETPLGPSTPAPGDTWSILRGMAKLRRKRRGRSAGEDTTQVEEELGTELIDPVDAEETEAEDETWNGGEDTPLVIAETTMAVRTMPVSMAVMQLDLSETPVVMFRNAANGALNVVYRRKDGNVGWIDPQRTRGNGTAKD